MVHTVTSLLQISCSVLKFCSPFLQCLVFADFLKTILPWRSFLIKNSNVSIAYTSFQDIISILFILLSKTVPFHGIGIHFQHKIPSIDMGVTYLNILCICFKSSILQIGDDSFGEMYLKNFSKFGINVGEFQNMSILSFMIIF